MKKLILSVFLFVNFTPQVFAENMEKLFESIRDKNEIEYQKIRFSKRGDSPREHTIDPYLENRAKKKSEYYDECKGKDYASFYAQLECTKSAGLKFRQDYPDRGTDEYSKIKYQNLSKEKAITKVNELLEKLDVVSFFPSEKNKEIELTVGKIEKEIFYIERHVLKINPRKYETR